MGQKLIIYGAGKRGAWYYDLFEEHGKENDIVAFCDINYANIKTLKGKSVVSLEEALSYKMPFWISIDNISIVKEVEKEIEFHHGKCMTIEDLAEGFGMGVETFVTTILERKIVVREECGFCGRESVFAMDREWIMPRDSVCSGCGCGLRASDLLKTIGRYEKINLHKGIAGELKDKKILNCGSTGYVHEAMKTCNHYIASEYYDNVRSGEINETTGIMCVDLQNMPFDDDSLEVVISEDVLEHVWNIEKAMNEVYRCLKNGGRHYFTIPLSEGINTKCRIENPNKVYHLDPLRSEGAFVASEFGLDFADKLRKIGFKTEIVYCHKFYEKDEITDLDATYDEYLKNVDSLDRYLKYNSIVFVCEKCKTEKV